MEISFAHNVYDRPKTLMRTLETEDGLILGCGKFVAYNNLEFEKHFDDLEYYNVGLKYFEQSTHKIGCVNGAYYSIKMALDHNSDVIIFSHDDVYISNPQLVMQHIEDIVSGKYDFIARTPSNLPDIGTKYVMMEAMFFSRKGAMLAYENFVPFVNEQDIERDLRGSISPEVNMYNLVQKIQNKNIIHYIHGNDGDQYNETLNRTLGFTHTNIGQRGWKE